MASYNKFVYAARATDIVTPEIRMLENPSMAIQVEITNSTGFTADVYLDMSLSQKEPDAETDWYAVKVAGTDDGDPIMTFAGNGTKGLGGFAGPAMWSRIRVDITAGTADIAISTYATGAGNVL